MGKRGNSKADQSIKNFCKSAAIMVTVKKKEQVDNRSQDVRRNSYQEIATATPSKISRSETSLAEWIKNRMQQKKQLLATS